MSRELLNDSSFAKPEGSGLYVKPRIDTTKILIRDNAGQLIFAVIGLSGTAARPVFIGPLYCSASDRLDAMSQFLGFHRERSFVTIYAAPAIGFFVQDNHGDKLSTRQKETGT